MTFLRRPDSVQASELRRLALYFDVGTKMWQPEEDWQQLSPDAWDALFRPGIAAPQEDEGGGSGSSACYLSKCYTHGSDIW